MIKNEKQAKFLSKANEGDLPKMAKPKLTIKYKRSFSGKHHNYGKDVESAISKLIGKKPKSQVSKRFPTSELKDGGGYLERHEDGPELFITVAQLLPSYITAAIALFGVWRLRESKQKKEDTQIIISGAGFEHKITIHSKDDLKIARKLIRYYGKKWTR